MNFGFLHRVLEDYDTHCVVLGLTELKFHCAFDRGAHLAAAAHRSQCILMHEYRRGAAACVDKAVSPIVVLKSAMTFRLVVDCWLLARACGFNRHAT